MCLFVKRALDKGIIEKTQFLSDSSMLNVEIATNKIIEGLMKRVKEAIGVIKEQETGCNKRTKKA